MQEATEPIILSDAADPLAAAALRAEAWAGEPFLREGEEVAVVLGPGTARRRALDDEDRWDDEPDGEDWEDEELDEGYAPWEVRVDARSRRAANTLAEQLEAEGYRPLRRWSYLIVGTASREDAEALAARLHGEVEPGGELVWENPRGNPFAIFGGLGSAGTPV